MIVAESPFSYVFRARTRVNIDLGDRVIELLQYRQANRIEHHHKQNTVKLPLADHSTLLRHYT